ncbi:group 1 truncated hemoglobin [Sphingomonas sp.]|jgi:hemoglobin|uniref:group I truncated hemoglobin n=1 Tax=Sphingomonas sp. TaxID=28214 RepID=UPI002ED93D14
MILTLLLLAAQVPPGEEPVPPYAHAEANAGATPFRDDAMFAAFHGHAGVSRIVDDLIARNLRDPRVGDIFKGQDTIRLHRLLKEHFCYVLGGGCAYTGRTMKDAHRDMGLQTADMGALVDNLQRAMQAEGVAFAAQNRFLAKLAPMKRDVVVR